jgi:hypothetical protein
MAGEDAVFTGTAAARKPRKVDEDSDELDNVPLAVSRGTKASNASSSKVKKEEDENSDNKPISLSRAKKVCLPLLIQKFRHSFRLFVNWSEEDRLFSYSHGYLPIFCPLGWPGHFIFCGF